MNLGVGALSDPVFVFATTPIITMANDQKTKKPFDLDQLILPEPARPLETRPQNPVPPSSPEPDPPPVSDKVPASRQGVSLETGDPDHGPVNRPVRILLTTLAGATALIWSFLLLIYLWDWILQ